MCRCGHCKNLAPHWAAAATELKGKVKLGAVDATVHKAVAGRYQVGDKILHPFLAHSLTHSPTDSSSHAQVEGFPTIKSWPAGKKTANDFEDYNGGRTTSDIVQWALERWTEKIPPPEIYQVS